MPPCPSLRMSMNALRSRLKANARLRSGFSKGGFARLTNRCVFTPPNGAISQFACGSWLCTSRISGTLKLKGQVMSTLPETNASVCRRHVLDDREFDAVEIGPAGFPVIRVLRHPNEFVGLELDEF